MVAKRDAQKITADAQETDTSNPEGDEIRSGRDALHRIWSGRGRWLDRSCQLLRGAPGQPIRKASEMMRIGERSELLRWRAQCDAMFAKVISADETTHEQ